MYTECQTPSNGRHPEPKDDTKGKRVHSVKPTLLFGKHSLHPPNQESLGWVRFDLKG